MLREYCRSCFEFTRYGSGCVGDECMNILCLIDILQMAPDCCGGEGFDRHVLSN